MAKTTYNVVMTLSDAHADLETQDSIKVLADDADEAIERARKHWLNEKYEFEPEPDPDAKRHPHKGDKMYDKVWLESVTVVAKADI